MKIEYIYPNKDKDNSDTLTQSIKQLQKENTLGCLVAGLVLLSGLFIVLALLPIILTILGWSILFLSVYILYKAYLEDLTLSLIEKLKSRR